MAPRTSATSGSAPARPAVSTLHNAIHLDALPEHVIAPLPRIEAYLKEAIASLPLPPALIAAMDYSALGPGKRARPLLAWHSFNAVCPPGSDPAGCLPAAAAVELVHAFSLVHDDLPGLDNDDTRRGRPTLHKHTSEAMAILAGDALLTSAFQVLAERVPSLTLQSRLMRELAVGTNGMIAGQVYDTLGGMPSDLDPIRKLELIHRHKTGMLIRAACRMGALSALEGHPGASRLDPLSCITLYAEAIGLMFQVVDDLLDVTQTSAHLGKKSNKDADAGKLTYPGVMGVEQTRAEVHRLYQLSLDAVEPLGEPAEPLRQLSTYMAVRTK